MPTCGSPLLPLAGERGLPGVRRMEVVVQIPSAANPEGGYSNDLSLLINAFLSGWALSRRVELGFTDTVVWYRKQPIAFEA